MFLVKRINNWGSRNPAAPGKPAPRAGIALAKTTASLAAEAVQDRWLGHPTT